MPTRSWKGAWFTKASDPAAISSAAPCGLPGRTPTGLAGCSDFGDLRDRHVPPRIRIPGRALLVDLDHDGGRALAGLSSHRARLRLPAGCAPESCAPKPRQSAAKSMGRARHRARRSGPTAVIRAESVRPDGLRKTADAREAVIVQKDDVQLEAFLNGGDDLRRHHQPRSVADHDIDLALRRGHLHAQPARDFVAHAGVAIFQVIAFGSRVRQSLCRSPGRLPAAHDHHILRAAEWR